MNRIEKTASPGRRSLARSLLAACLLAGLASGAAAQGAQAYPAKPIRIVVPFAPGGASDILARTIGQKLTEKWNQPVIVLLLDVSALTIGPALDPKLPYNPSADFAPVTMVVFSPFVLTANAALPVNTMQELLAFGKANPNALNFASVTNATRLAAAKLKIDAGLDMLVVPYKSGGAALTAITGGEANLTMASVLSTYPHIKGGRIKGIGIASARRMDAAPEIPTIIEGGVPNYVTGSWQGLLAPAATPPDVVRKINAAVVEILNTRDTKDRLVSQGAEVVGNSPQDFARFLRDETDRWGKIVKEANIKIEQ